MDHQLWFFLVELCGGAREGGRQSEAEHCARSFICERCTEVHSAQGAPCMRSP